MEIAKKIIYNQPKHFPFEIKYQNGYVEYELIPEIFLFRRIFFTGRGHILKKDHAFLNLAANKYSFNYWGFKKKIIFIAKGFFELNIFFNKNILFVDDWTNNPYHFIVDFMCKLEFLESKLGSLERYELILNNSLFAHDFAVGILNKFNFKFKKIKFVEKQSLNFSFGQIITTSKITENGTSNRRMLESILNRKSLIIKRNKFNKIYYYRQNTKRIILNNDDVLTVFRKRGFICIDFVEYKLKELIPLIENSSCLIGLHGAGLSNMIFLPKNSLIVEFKTKNRTPKNHCYWHLAQNLNLNYQVFIVESEFDSNDILEGSCGVNVVVNIPLLENYLDTLELYE